MKSLSLIFAIVLFGFSLTVFSQEDRSVILNAPSAVKTSAKMPASPSSVPEKETIEKLEQETLRDPFWAIGFFPPNWQKKTNVQSQLGAGDAGGWAAASAGLRISGTSRLGDRTVAIINGEMKNVGEQVGVSYEGKMYQWEIIGIGANGQIQMKKIGVR